MENLWTPLFSLTVFLIVFAVGRRSLNKTKGLDIWNYYRGLS